MSVHNLTTNDRTTNSGSVLGFTSSLVDITAIQISQPQREDFAINQLSLITTGVPEPDSIALLGLGLAGLGFGRRRRAIRATR